MRILPLTFAATLLGGCGTMQINEGQFIRPDAKGSVAAPRLDLPALLPGMTATEDAIATPDGATLRGVWLRRPGAGATVLYFGGNSFHLDVHGKQVLGQLAACGTDVAVFDYRGYGRSSGAPSVATMQADALRIFDHVNARQPGGVVVHGMSLGSFMAAHVAARRPAARALVLEATATTVQDWTDANLPWYARLFLKVEVGDSLKAVDNVAAVRGYHGRSLVLAGENDTVTPPALGRRVFDALPGTDKQWLVAPGAGHNTILDQQAVGPVYCKAVRG